MRGFHLGQAGDSVEMSNTKRARVQTEQSHQLLRMTWLAVQIDDKQFDQWLMRVVQARAGKGSLRAIEMLEVANEP